MRKVRGSFLFVGSNQGIDNERRKNSVEGGNEKEKKGEKNKGNGEK